MILVGDCLEVLKTLPAESVQTCVTSPPYFGLRDYGVAEQIGLEKTPDEYVAKMVAVFREVRRVLRDDGTLWLNLGDSYAASPGQRKTSDVVGPKQRTNAGSNTVGSRDVAGVAAGNVLNVPHRVAAALQSDGWFWRSTIIWAKRSPMPESISGWRWVRCRVKVEKSLREFKGHEVLQGARNGSEFNSRAKWAPCPGCKKCEPTGGYRLRRGKWRPTCGHEYVFLLSKSERYFCDGDAVQELAVGGAPGNKATHKYESAYTSGDRLQRTKAGLSDITARETRNPRSVWTLSNEPFKGAHFAVYPTALPRRAIEAATSAAGCCPTCGACWAPIVETERVATRPGNQTKVGRVSVHAESPYQDHNGTICGNRDPQRHTTATRILGYRPSCNCNAGAPVPCVVLDPFGGSGTTGQVANALGRRYVLIEVNPDYVELIRKRVETPLREHKAKKRARLSPLQLSLFE